MEYVVKIDYKYFRFKAESGATALTFAEIAKAHSEDEATVAIEIQNDGEEDE